MGRKSRYKKFKAVDPYCTGQRKALLIRQGNVFNKAPKKDDFEQKPPKGFLDLMDSIAWSKNQAKPPKGKRRKDEDAEEDISEKKSKNEKFKRRPWESDEQFLGRVDRLAGNIIAKEKMEIVKSGGDKEPAPKKLTKEKERKLKRLKKSAEEAKKMRLEERKEYAKAVKNDKMLDSIEKEMMKDTVKFGEVAMEPPTLTKAPRKSQDAAKPGQRELLLKGLINPGPSQKHSKKANTSGKARLRKANPNSKEIKRRKDMSSSEKMRFDRTREAVIEAYRKQKNTRRIELPQLGDGDPS
ncbi:coiled-coil domain-containing protein 137-like [Diadema antillarum]|uniref:coiled-coil domain-containing protein 137-like n=1 Tax=Diadema antillarum TaxID=105358 RepID=UPI003A8C3BEB